MPAVLSGFFYGGMKMKNNSFTEGAILPKLAMPCSTVLQIIMCFAAYVHFKRNVRGNLVQTADKN